MPCETRLVNDLLEVDGDLCALAVAVVGRVVDEFGDLVESQLWKGECKKGLQHGVAGPSIREAPVYLLRPPPEDKKHRVNDIRLAAAVRAHDSRK